LVLPACDVDNVHVPAFTMVTVNDETVQTAVVVEVNETARSDEAVGATVKVLADHGRSVGAAKVIDCEACEIVKLRETETAALK
jgi:hypothetical protein